MKNDNGSLYDFMSNDYEAPKHAPQAETGKPKARRDLSAPVGAVFAKKAREAVTCSGDVPSSELEWLKFIMQRSPRGRVSLIVNKQFDRNKINGHNYEEERSRYIDLYNNQSKASDR